MNRYEHIDIAKGIGILLVVFFHLPNIEKLALFAYWGGVDYDFLHAFVLCIKWNIL